MAKQLKWPGINVTSSDRDLIARIRQDDGVLKNMEMKQLLMMAATISVKKNLPKSHDNGEKLDKNVMHPTLLNQPDYEEYRQYIALLYYLTQGDKKIESLNDASLMVKNFVDLAQRGLRYLETTYLESKSGSDDLMDEYLTLLESNKN